LEFEYQIILLRWGCLKRLHGLVVEAWLRLVLIDLEMFLRHTAQAVSEELGDYLADGDLILDGGACDVGVRIHDYRLHWVCSEGFATGCNYCSDDY
jgi:hypothetical protein